MSTPAAAPADLVGRVARVLERDGRVDVTIEVRDDATGRDRAVEIPAAPPWTWSAFRAARLAPSVQVEMDDAGRVQSVAY